MKLVSFYRQPAWNRDIMILFCFILDTWPGTPLLTHASFVEKAQVRLRHTLLYYNGAVI